MEEEKEGKKTKNPLMEFHFFGLWGRQVKRQQQMLGFSKQALQMSASDQLWPPLEFIIRVEGEVAPLLSINKQNCPYVLVFCLFSEDFKEHDEQTFKFLFWFLWCFLQRPNEGFISHLPQSWRLIFPSVLLTERAKACCTN